MSQTIGIKRRYNDAFCRDSFDSFGREEYFPIEPDTKKLKQEEETSFCITMKSTAQVLPIHRVVGVYQLEQKKKLDDQYNSVMRMSDTLEITEFAFHNPVASHQAIKILGAANEIVAKFNIGAIAFDGFQSLNENHPYKILFEYLKEEKCCGVAPAGMDHLFLLYVSPEHQCCISAALIRKFYFVIDLDDTLVRSRIPKEPYDEPTPEEQVFQVGPHRVYTKVLENVYPFLKWADQLFNIVFVTNSIFLYASNIVRILDPNRTNILSRVRSLDHEGLSGILKHRADLICVLSEVSSINNNIGLSDTEKKELYDSSDEVDEDIDDDYCIDTTTSTEMTTNDQNESNPKKSHKSSTKKKVVVVVDEKKKMMVGNPQATSDGEKRQRKGFLGKKNCNQPPPSMMKQVPSNKENQIAFIPPPPPPPPSSSSSTTSRNNISKRMEVPNNQPVQPQPIRTSTVNNSKQTTRPKFIFIKDLETLGFPVHRSVVIDDQKHVWARNQFNCLPFPQVNDGNGLKMKEIKSETFKKIMELQLRFCYHRFMNNKQQQQQQQRKKQVL